MDLPLDGIRVVEVTMWVAGPTTGMVLGDLGAEVIKIESPNSPDPSRGLRVGQGLDLRTEDGKMMCYESFNRNKRGIAVDLRTPEGQEILHRLVARADIFVTNLLPPALTARGADFDTLREVNPRIIYAIARGLGAKGPRANDRVQDTIGMAYSGFMYTAAVQPGVPHYPPGSFSDVLTGTMVAFGAVAAVQARDRTDRAQFVESSQVQSMMWLQFYNFAAAANLGRTFDAHAAKSPLVTVYECADGAWIAIGLLRADTQWPTLCEIFGREEVALDPRFDSEVQRDLHRDELDAFMREQFLRRPRDEWLDPLRDAGIWCGPVNSVEDLVDDDHVRAEGYITTVDNGLTMVGTPFGVDDMPKRGAPAYAAETSEVLAELGYSDEEIVQLNLSDVVR